MSGFAIKVSPNLLQPGSYNVDMKGELIRQLTPEDRALFKMTDSQIKEAVNKFYNMTPDEVYINDPVGDDGAMFKGYGWDPVSLHLKPIFAVVTNPKIESSDVGKQIKQNKSDIEVEMDGAFETEVENSTETNWSTTSELKISEAISFDFEFFGSTTTLSFSQQWQEGGSKTKTMTVGQTSGIKVKTPPKTEFHFTNTANIGTATIQITYEASLSGGIVAKYRKAYQAPGSAGPHYFYYIQLQYILPLVGSTNSQRSVMNMDTTGYEYSTTSVSGPFPIGASIENSDTFARSRRVIAVNPSAREVSDDVPARA